MIGAWIVTADSSRAVLAAEALRLPAPDGLAKIDAISSQEMGDIITATGKKVLTLTGYSDAGYQQFGLVTERFLQALANRSPDQWLVCAGATATGIGMLYPLAREKGFATLGIVSTLALKRNIKLADDVDYLFYIEDKCWGGRTPEGKLTPTSKAYVEHGDEFLALGGNAVTREEMLAAHQAGKPVTYFPAEMNHERAVKMALSAGRPPPKDFRGLAYAALSAFR